MATNRSLIHYALDQELPPVLACDTPAKGAFHTEVASDVTCPRCRASEQFPRLHVQPPKANTLTTYRVLIEASSLIGGDGENPEYERAIVELTSLLVGASLDDAPLVTRILRALASKEN